MSYSPFVGQNLKFHRFGRHTIQGYTCSVYYSEFFNFICDTPMNMVVTVIIHVHGKNPKLHYIISEDGSVRSYTNLDFNQYENERIRLWVEMHSNVLWCKGVEKRKNRVLPQIY